MLSAAFALVLAQTPVATPPVTLNLIKPGANCPDNGAIVASNPAINRPYLSSANGFPDMVHMPEVYMVNTVYRTVDGCYKPMIRSVLFTGKPAGGARPDASKPKP